MTNQQKSGVDVLAAIGLHAEMREAAGKPNLAKDLRDVRAAVAELIEDREALAKALRDILEAGIEGPGHVRLFNAGRAALARVGGAQ